MEQRARSQNNSGAKLAQGSFLAGAISAWRFVLRILLPAPRSMLLALTALLCAFAVFSPRSLLLAPCFSAQAQQPGNIPRIGFLAATKPAAVAARVAAGLRELGYIEGKNIVIEYRYSEGKSGREHNLALCRLRRQNPERCQARQSPGGAAGVV